MYNFATTDGARITQWTRNTATNQQWQFVDSGGGYYRLKSRHSGKVLDVYNWSTANGARHRAVDRRQRHQPAVAPGRLGRRLRAAASTATAARPSRCRAPPPPTAPTSSSTPTGAATTSSGNSSPSAAPHHRHDHARRRPGTFTNPVVWQDFADGDIIRVGDAYYYSASTMHYSPGAPILRSYDLVQLGVRRATRCRGWTSAPTPTTSPAAAPTSRASGRRRSTTARATAPTTGSAASSSTAPTSTPPTAVDGTWQKRPRSTTATTTPACSSTTTTPCTWPTATRPSAWPSSPPTGSARCGRSRCSPRRRASAPWRAPGSTSATATTTSG